MLATNFENTLSLLSGPIEKEEAQNLLNLYAPHILYMDMIHDKTEIQAALRGFTKLELEKLKFLGFCLFVDESMVLHAQSEDKIFTLSLTPDEGKEYMLELFRNVPGVLERMVQAALKNLEAKTNDSSD